MAQKLGLQYDPQTDPAIITALTDILKSVETDFTLFFRGLALFDPEQNMDQTQVPRFWRPSLYRPDQSDENDLEQIFAWLNTYGNRLKQEGIPQEVRQKKMNQVNPKFVLRNYLAQTAIDKAEQGDFSRIEKLLDILGRPYEEQGGNEKFAEKRPEWARHRPGCSMLSCSS